jgi:hypothetical protein
LGTGELGGSDNLHGVGDLLDVADGLKAVLDFAESRKGGGAWGSGAISAPKLVL